MLSKYDVSVHLACLNTWCYLLPRLGTSLNDCSMINLVLDPIFEAAFQLDPDGRSFWARDVCINLLDDFISAKCKPLDYDPRNQVIQQSSAKTSVHSPIMSGSCSWKRYPINWLPWDLSLLDFHLKMIYSLIRQSSRQTVCLDSKVPAVEAPLRLFRAVLKGVEHEFKRLSINYDDIMLCLNAILKFIRNICEEVSLDGSDRHGLHHIALQFIEAVSEEVEPTMMGSPLYKVALNIKYIENLHVLPALDMKNQVSALLLIWKWFHLKQDILSLLEMISSPLLEWLRHMETQAEGTCDQFELLWIEMLNCLRRSQPPIVFDSAFLKLQAYILEKTLEHSKLSILEPTITFWNTTYGGQVDLDYPQTLRHVLDKLWRKGRINLRKRSLPLQRCQSKSEAITAPPRFRVNTAHSRGSKRVELVGNTMDMPHSNLKRKRVELTEHQKEVRRAQRGRGRDYGGHGIGFQTYTTLDFSQGNGDSQGNEDSQDSEDVRHPECILQMLRNR